MMTTLPVKRIAIDLRMVFCSGIGTYIRNLVPRVIELLSEADFSLLGNKEDILSLPWTRAKNIHIIPCDGMQYSPTGQIFLWKAIRKKKFDVFWSPHLHLPLFSKGPFLVTVHDLPLELMNRPILDFPKRFYMNLLLRKLKKTPATVVCDSDFTRDSLLKSCPLDRKNAHTVHCGLDPSFSQAQKDKTPYLKPFLLFVGNVKPHKNLSRLLDAFLSIQNQIPHHLVIVGKKEGFITGDKQVLKKANALLDRIHFTGIVDEKQLKQFYLHAEVLVFPSLFEGFGFPLLEAMACGCPTIVSRAASLPEICRDASLYCDPLSIEDIAEKILVLLRDKSLRNSLIEKGKKNASHYHWAENAEKVAGFISQFSITA